MTAPQELVERLLRATNDHDLDGVVECFAENYENETPTHPARSFRGRDQVRRNWEQIFANVDDIRAEVLRLAVDGDTAWTEWEMIGTRGDGTAHHMRGVIVLGVQDGAAQWARFYLEPVDQISGDVNDAVRNQVVRRMILVAGGTGRLGTLVVARLVADHREVRVLTRDPARASHLPDAVEIALGDVRDRASIDGAMEGVTTVVSAVQGFAGPGRVSPESVDRDGNAHLVDAAASAEARVVLMSVVGAAADHPMELFRAKFAAEEHLRATTASWTIVRATAFVELWATIMAKPIVFGRGDNPINFVSVNDVAAVVERAVVDPTRRGQVLEVGGPQNVTFNELANLLQETRGSHDKVRHVPRGILRMAGIVARQPRAGLAMDTIDLTFDAASNRAAFADLPITDLRATLVEVAAAQLRS